MSPSHPGLVALGAAVLRRPVELVDSAADSPERLAHLLPRLVLLVVLGGAIFGAVTGMHRGGLQVLYASLKLPVLLLLPPLVVMPAARALWAMEGATITPQRLTLAFLVGMARTAVLSTALTPPLWLLYRTGLPHRAALVCMLWALALVGLPGLYTAARAIAPGVRALRAQLVLVTVLGLVFAQTGWMLRPFMSLPDRGYPLLCPVDQDIFSGLAIHLGDGAAEGTDWDCADPIYLVRP